MDTSISQQPQIEHFHFGHVGVIALTAILLLGISWMKNPQMFSDAFNKSAPLAETDVPRYYAYVEPAEANMPMVAGASTENQDEVSVFNEDGSISRVDIGEVLGASTDQVNSSLTEIKAKIVADTEEAISNYAKKSVNIEADYMNNMMLEQALSSGNQSQMDQVAEKLNGIVLATQELEVPKSLERLHRLKLLQYQAASDILKNYNKIDQAPEQVSQSLGVFLQTQQLIQNENENLKQKFPEYDPGA